MKILRLFVCTNACIMAVAALAQDSRQSVDPPQSSFSRSLRDLEDQLGNLSPREYTSALEDLITEHWDGDSLQEMKALPGPQSFRHETPDTSEFTEDELELHEIEESISEAIATIRKVTEDPRLLCSRLEQLQELNTDLFARAQDLQHALVERVKARSQSFDDWVADERAKLSSLAGAQRDLRASEIDLAAAIEDARVRFDQDPRRLCQQIEDLMASYSPKLIGSN